MSTSVSHEPGTALAEQPASHVSSYEVLPPVLPPPEPARPRLLIIASSLAAFGVVAAFASLIGVYLSLRAQAIAAGEVWLPDGVDIPLTQPNFMAITLVMSAVAMAWAVYAGRNDDRANTLIAVGLTLLFGFAYISQTMFLLTLMDLPIAESGVQGWLIWAIVGGHVAVIGMGMAYVAAMGVRTIGGQLTPRLREGLNGAALFWFVAVALYLVIWYAIYITK